MFIKACNIPTKNLIESGKKPFARNYPINKQQVWGKTLKSLMPHNCRCLKNKWDFQIICNGVHHACLVACGCSQVSGINFSEKFSPIVKNITFWMLLSMVIHFGYKEINMECSQCTSDVGKDYCIFFKKCIYGIVQAMRQYHKMAVKILIFRVCRRQCQPAPLYQEKCEGYSIHSSLHM